jgi:hypothetical protein
MSSHRYVLFRKETELDPTFLQYRKCKNIWDIRYKKETERSKTIYVQSPSLELSLIEEDGHNYYLIFKMEDDGNFNQLIERLDIASLEEICNDPASWGFKENTPISVMESYYLPTLRRSTVNLENSFYLTVAKTDKITLYDQNEVPIDFSALQVGYKITLLMLLDGVENKNDCFKLKFILEQAKVKIPQQEEQSVPETASVPEPEKIEDEEEDDNLPEGECLITESDEDNDLVSTYFPEMTKYNDNPKEDLYEYEQKIINMVETETTEQTIENKE